jgi:hypothetical protein
VPALHCVFDTNVYRTLSLEGLSHLRALESKRGVEAIASYWPAIELAAHVADPTDAAHGAARGALLRLWQHASSENEAATTLSLVADTDSMLAMGLFSEPIPGRAGEANAYATMIGEFATAYPGPVPEHVQPLFAYLRSHVAEQESEFADDMWAIVRDLDPTATGWQPFSGDPALRRALVQSLRRDQFLRHLAEHRVAATAMRLGRTIDQDSLSTRVDYVLKYFPTAMVFFRNLVIGIVQSAVDYRLSKHMNSWWDPQLCFLVSPGASVDRIPTILVTNEQKIHTSAAESGHGAYALTLPEYQAALESGLIDRLGESLAMRRLDDG